MKNADPPNSVGLLCEGTAETNGRPAADERDELATFHCPVPPVLRTERIADLGRADCCIHPPGQNEMIPITPPKNSFQGGSPKTGHPSSPPGISHRQKSFQTKFPGMASGCIFDFRAPQGGL